MQAGQKTHLALTMDSLAIDVCCASETRFWNLSAVIQISDYLINMFPPPTPFRIDGMPYEIVSTGKKIEKQQVGAEGTR